MYRERERERERERKRERERLQPCFFVTFNIIIRHAFPENIIKVPQFVGKIWSFCPSILTIFLFFWHFLVRKKQMTSTDYASIFVTCFSCSTIVLSYIDVRLVLLEIWRAGSNWPASFVFKSKIFTRLQITDLLTIFFFAPSISFVNLI